MLLRRWRAKVYVQGTKTENIGQLKRPSVALSPLSSFTSRRLILRTSCDTLGGRAKRPRDRPDGDTLLLVTQNSCEFPDATKRLCAWEWVQARMGERAEVWPIFQHRCMGVFCRRVVATDICWAAPHAHSHTGASPSSPNTCKAPIPSSNKCWREAKQRGHSHMASLAR